MNTPMFEGSMVALVTPMHVNGDIDWQRLSDLIEWQIESGTDALIAVGTTGESATLSVEEHSKVIEFFIQQTRKRIPIIAGTGANATREAVVLTEKAKQAGADAALLVAPYYNKPTQEGLYQHYKFIAEQVAIPQILYNVPGRTVADISNETVVRLADIDNIVAIKDATGDVARGKALIEAVSGRLTVLSGDDNTALDMVEAGARGSISVTTNIVPAVMAQAFKAALAGDILQARKLDAPIRHLHNDLFIESSPIPVKYALYKMGKIDKGIRLPMTWLLPEYQTTMDNALEQAGLI